jgi:nitrate reductase (NAD(P)H)
MVSPEMSAQDRKWWTDDRYAIYDLNVNSVAAYPQHEEELDLSTAGPTYTAKGYAYAGGGRRITRVEISLDGGKCKFTRYDNTSKMTEANTHVSFPAWRLAEIEYAEDKYRNFEGDLFGGKVDMWWRESSFCWSFWSLEIPVPDMEVSDAILVRAVDEALAVQPRDMYWSVLGMMNNPWFRVTITKKGDVLKFEHPTHPARAGGWMEKVKQAGGDLLNGNWGERTQGEGPVEPEPVREINMKKDGVSRQIDLQELKANSASEQPWFVVNGEVYDGTGFLEGHPGGAISITSSAGLDVSEDFLAIRTSHIKQPRLTPSLTISQTVRLPRQ